jgi:hypothetical protein
VAAQIGYCGLDRQRRPLHGDEIRECWESLDAPGAPGAPARPTLGPAAGWALDPGENRTTVRLLDFVEVRAEGDRDAAGSVPATDTRPGDAPDQAPAQPFVTSAGEPRWSLWGDAEA